MGQSEEDFRKQVLLRKDNCNICWGLPQARENKLDFSG